MREVYIGKPITLQNKKFSADEFYMVEPALALVIVSSGCGVYSDNENDEKNPIKEKYNECNFNTKASYR